MQQHDKTLVVKQIKSGFGRKPGQQATLIGLGLNKIGRSVALGDSSQVQGMLRKVSHLVDVKVA